MRESDNDRRMSVVFNSLPMEHCNYVVDGHRAAAVEVGEVDHAVHHRHDLWVEPVAPVSF